MNDMAAFSKLHPMTIFLYFISMLFVSVSFDSPVIILTMCAVMLLYRVKSNGMLSAFKQMLLFVPFVFFCAVVNALLNHRGETVFLYINDAPITLESTANGLFTGIMIVTLFMLFAFYNEVMEQHKFLYLFSGIAPMTALMVSMVFRYIPLCMGIFNETLSVEQTINNKKRSLPEKIRYYSALFLSCISKSLEFTVNASLSMRARGYGIAARTNAQKIKFSHDDAVTVAITALVDAVIIYFAAIKKYDFVYYNKMSEIRFDFGTLFFLVLFILPLAVELSELIQWKLSQRRI